MPILYLLFGHLVGDFILQPNELIQWKFSGWRGIFFHTIIHFMAYLLVFFPYLPGLTVFLTILGVSGAHFVIDLTKINAEKKGRRFRRYFLLDQFAHLIVMIGAGMLLAGMQPYFASMGIFSILYENPLIIAGLIMLILCTSFLEIWFFQVKRERTPEVRFKPDYGAMLKRAAVFTALYGAFVIFGVYKVAAMG